jgi:hypothetical protein
MPDPSVPSRSDLANLVDRFLADLRAFIDQLEQPASAAELACASPEGPPAPTAAGQAGG